MNLTNNIWFICGGSFSDFLDGFIARKRNMESDLGKIIDPIADKMLVTTTSLVVLVTFSLFRLTPIILTMFASLALILARDFAVDATRMFVLSKRKKVIAANNFGKIKTVLHMLALGFMVASFVFPNQINVIKLSGWVITLFVVTTVVSLISGYIYIAQAIKK